MSAVKAWLRRVLDRTVERAYQPRHRASGPAVGPFGRIL